LFCQKCSEEIKSGNSFCTKCGTPVPEVAVQPQPSKTVRPITPTEKSTQNKILRIVGGILIIVSIFLPFSSKGTASMWSTITPFLLTITGVADIIPVSFVLMTAGFILLLIGGITAFFTPLIGVILAILALISFSVTIHMTMGGFAWISAMGLGYFLAWLGTFISICSHLLEMLMSQ
jgi:hypothetical protein